MVEEILILKTSTNQAPRYAQPGIDYEEGWFVLELKVLADVGLGWVSKCRKILHYYLFYLQQNLRLQIIHSPHLLQILELSDITIINHL